MNRYFYKFLLLPTIAVLFLLFLTGFAVACLCTAQDKGKHVPFYVIKAKAIGENKQFPFQTNFQTDQLKPLKENENLLKKIFTVANHLWFFSKEADYQKNLLYQKIINGSKFSNHPHKEEFLQAYLSRKNKSFNKIVLALPTGQYTELGGELNQAGKKSFILIKDLFFTNKTLKTKKINLNEVYLQFDHQWLLAIQIKKIILNSTDTYYDAKKKEKKYSNFASLAGAELILLDLIKKTN